MENEARTHVLIVPYPGQGHINPMHQFAKRIVSKGIKATLVVTKFISKSMHGEPGKIGVEIFSDGYDDGGFSAAENVDAYLSRFTTVGSETLTEVIKKQESSGYPVSCVIYDSFMPWALDVAHGFGIQAGAFFTQSCTVNNIFYQFHEGLLDAPESYAAADPTLPISIPGLPTFRPKDLPSFFYIPGYYGAYFKMLLNQYSNLKEADWIFVNTYKELEVEEINNQNIGFGSVALEEEVVPLPKVVGIVVGAPLEGIVRGIEEVNSVPEMCQLIDEEQAFGVIVEYAHTLDALSRLLDTVREFSPRRIITVIGCGGDRDRGKRPMMAKIATNKSDVTMLKSNNPRTEDPFWCRKSITKILVFGLWHLRKSLLHYPKVKTKLLSFKFLYRYGELRKVEKAK